MDGIRRKQLIDYMYCNHPVLKFLLEHIVGI